jgi:hypothetical protein
MTTKIYGASDNLIEIESDSKQGVGGEVSYYGTEDSDKGVLIICSDGTLLGVKYGKGGMGIWAVTLLNTGNLFEKIEPCTDEDAGIYSDVAYFKDGLKWAYAAKEWERMN